MKKRRDRQTVEDDSALRSEQSVAQADDPRANRRSARAFLIAAAHAAVIIPLLAYLQFGEVSVFILSFTGSMVVLCLLVALGYSVQDNPVRPSAGAGKLGLSARVGAFWLVTCAFGPFFGWLVVTPQVPLTEGNWWWRYAARAALSVGLPVLTALPLLPYVRGKYWHVALLLLVGVTALPVWSGVNTLLDLREGPAAVEATGLYDATHNSFYPDSRGRPHTLSLLRHTGRAVKIEPSR
jgi:hypothetical protein